MSSKKYIQGSPLSGEVPNSHELTNNKEEPMTPKQSETISRAIFSEKKLISPPQNKSFSDIIAMPDKISKTDLDLEQELDQCQDRTLHAFNPASQHFNESSIQKNDETNQHNNSSELEIKKSLGQSLAIDVKSQKIPTKIMKSSFKVQMPQQFAKPQGCVLCHNSQETKNELNRIKKLEGKLGQSNLKATDLINPCLCQIKVHRYCFKSAIISEHYTGCKTCNSEYAIGTKGKNFKLDKIENCRRNLITVLIIVAYLAVILGSAFGIKSVVSDSDSSSLKFSVSLILIVLIIVVTCLLVYYIFKKYFVVTRMELEVYCKQKEIAYHQNNPFQILDLYIHQQNAENRSTISYKMAQKYAKKLSFGDFERLSGYEQNQKNDQEKNVKNQTEKQQQQKVKEEPKFTNTKAFVPVQMLSQTFLISDQSRQGGDQDSLEDSDAANSRNYNSQAELKEKVVKKKFQKQLFINSQDLEQVNQTVENQRNKQDDIEDQFATDNLPTMSDFSTRLDEKNHVGDVPDTEYPTATKNIEFIQPKKNRSPSTNRTTNRTDKMEINEKVFSPRLDSQQIAIKILPQTEVNPQSPEINNSNSRLITALLNDSSHQRELESLKEEDIDIKEQQVSQQQPLSSSQETMNKNIEV